MTAFDEVVELSTAGLPQNKDVKWTYLSYRQIREGLLEKGLEVSLYYVKQMLTLRVYVKRSLLKMNTLEEVEGRNEQFEKIAAYRTSFSEQGLPIISIDTKKKELLGDFNRAGQAYSTGERHTKDHHFLTSAVGQLVPHGIYDVNDNTGYVTLGTSKDTSEFVCDNIRYYWTELLQYKYPDKDTMLLLCDEIGRASCRERVYSSV